jgi:hypothetical protein
MRDDLAILADDLERAFFKLRLHRNQPAPLAIQRAVVMLRLMASEAPTLWMVTDEDDPIATPVILFKAQAIAEFPYFTHPHVTELYASPRVPMPHEKPFADTGQAGADPRALAGAFRSDGAPGRRDGRKG